MFYCEAEQPCGLGQDGHFLEACSMCQRPLTGNRDIFMYKGNTAFCSSACRQEQIEMDSRPWQPKKTATAAATTTTAAWDISASLRAITTAAMSWRPASGASATTAAATIDPEYFWF